MCRKCFIVQQKIGFLSLLPQTVLKTSLAIVQISTKVCFIFSNIFLFSNIFGIFEYFGISSFRCIFVDFLVSTGGLVSDFFVRAFQVFPISNIDTYKQKFRTFQKIENSKMTEKSHFQNSKMEVISRNSVLHACI